MMKRRLFSLVGIVSMGVALTGCANFGNTHAMLTPWGVAGYHTFKPQNTAPSVPQPPNPDRMAAANTSDSQNEQSRD